MKASLRRIRVLVGKEFARLWRNPPALMAVGLLLLMALMLSVDDRRAGRSAAAGAPALPVCWIVYWEDDGFIPWLRRSTAEGARAGAHGANAAQAPAPPRAPVRFLPVDRVDRSGGEIRYPPTLSCAIEWRLADGEVRLLLQRATAQGKAHSDAVTRWLLAAALQYYGKQSVHTRLLALPATAAAPARSVLGSVDLKGPQVRPLAAAMLVFSLQFFVCCALFVSFTSHERERGILQALALTRATPLELLLSKYLFHLLLSALATAIIVVVLAPALLTRPALWLLWLPLWLVLSLGLLAVATTLSACARTQTTASLLGFCYLMGVGIVFALSRQFPAFAVLRELMFENHAVRALHALLSIGEVGDARQHFATWLAATAQAALLAPLLLAFAVWLFLRRGWRDR